MSDDNQSNIDARDDLAGKLRSEGRIVVDNPNPVKISDCILELIRPMLRMDDKFEDLNGKICLGILAWNLGITKLHDPDTYKKTMDDLKSKMTGRDFMELFFYISQKTRLFRDYNQYVMDFMLKPDKNRMLAGFSVVTVPFIDKTKRGTEPGMK
jgi:hypothetical protein